MPCDVSVDRGLVSRRATLSERGPLRRGLLQSIALGPGLAGMERATPLTGPAFLKGPCERFRAARSEATLQREGLSEANSCGTPSFRRLVS